MKVTLSPSEMIQKAKSSVYIIIGLSLLIENVVLVEGLKHNLLSISQLCDKGVKVIFDDFTYDILDKKIVLVFFLVFMKTLFTWPIY